MASKEKNTLRFAVGTPDNILSWVWRMWTNGDDVYLGARNALQVFKVSLHKSGIWRIAFVDDLERADKESDRVIVKWQRPKESSSKWTPSIGVLVSPIEAKQPFNKKKIEDSRIKWIDKPSISNKRFIFKVVLSDPGVTEEDLRKIAPEAEFVGSVVTRSNETAWLILLEDSLTEIEAQKIKDVMEKTKIQLKAGGSSETIGDSRALLVVSEDTPTATTQPTIIDIALGKENLEFGQTTQSLNFTDRNTSSKGAEGRPESPQRPQP